MPRPSKQPKPATDPDAAPPVADEAGVVQVKVLLLGIGPMVWRRLLLPDTCSLRELHGMIQVAMGWEGIHLYQFCLRSGRYGSWEVSASSPDMTLAELKLRRGARFTYEHDLNIPWRHEIRIEESRLDAEPGKALPRCIAGDGACPPEDCGGPQGHLECALDAVMALSPPHRDGQWLRKRYGKLRSHLFTFLDHPEVPADNNCSERELRPTATYRKVTGGFRSTWGADLFAGVRSVVSTAARRGIGAYQAIQQTLRGQAYFYPG